MSDIVERLRRWEPLLANEEAEMLLEAADEIERLREALAKALTLKTSYAVQPPDLCCYPLDCSCPLCKPPVSTSVGNNTRGDDR